MKVQKFLRAIGFVAAFAVAGLAQAGVATVSVDSRANSIGGGVAKDSGIALVAGQFVKIDVDSSQLWNFSHGDSSYDTDANGKMEPGWVVAALNPDGTYFTGVIGSLVGQIGNGNFFTVGTHWEGAANASGKLSLHYWDSDAWNNIGSVKASVTVPEPASMILLALGLLALAGIRRRA